MARRRRWGLQQIEDSLAGLGDLTRSLSGRAETPARPTASRGRTAVDEQLEGLAELAAELDLGLPGTPPAETAGAPPPTIPETAPPAPLNGDRSAPAARTLSEPAPGVLVLARPGVDRDLSPGRAWSPAAAMEPLAPLAPVHPAPLVAAASTELLGDPEPNAGRRAAWPWLALAAVVGVLAALALAAVLLLGRHGEPAATRPPAHPTATPPATVFGVDGLRLVSAGASDPFAAPAQTSFPDGTGSIVIDVAYHGASAGTPLGVSLSRLAGPGQPVTPLLDTSYILTPEAGGRGQNAIVIATPLSTGHYLLNASYAGRPLFAGGFDVAPPPPPPSPTPRRR